MQDEAQFGSTISDRINRIEKFLDMSTVGAFTAPGTDQRDYGDETNYRDNVTAQYDRAKAERCKVEAHRERALKQNIVDQTQPEHSAFEDVIQRIYNASERVLTTARTLEIIGDRILGALPETADGSNGVEARPDGTLDHTYQALNVLDNALTRLHFVTVRLERI